MNRAVVVRCPCPTCHTIVELGNAEPGARCPSCREPLGLTATSSALLHEVISRRAQAAELGFDAARATVIHKRQYGWRGHVLVALFAVIAIGSGFLVSNLSMTTTMSDDAFGWTVVAGMMTLMIVLTVGGLLWQNRPRMTRTEPEPLVLPGPPTAEVLAGAADDAERDLRRAALDRQAALRSAYLAAQSRSAAGNLTVVLGTVFLVLTAVVAVTFTVDPPQDAPTAAPLTAWAIVALLAALVAGSLARRRAHRRRLLSGARALASLLGGAVGDGVAWLNEHWPAPIDDNDLYASDFHVGVVAMLGGRPLLVDFEPVGMAAEEVWIPPRLFVYLAAPGITALPPIGQGQLAATLEPGSGIVLRAGPDLLLECARDPDRLAALAPHVRKWVW